MDSGSTDTRPREYDFSHGRKGSVIIISNKQFYPLNLMPLAAQKYDVQKLKEDFETMGFRQEDIKLFEDKKAKDMLKILEDVGSEDHSDSDCIVCVILSHGEWIKVKVTSGREEWQLKDAVFGTDVAISLPLLMEPLANAKTLAGKPKIFIVDACRGHERSAAVKVPTSRRRGQPARKHPGTKGNDGAVAEEDEDEAPAERSQGHGETASDVSPSKEDREERNEETTLEGFPPEVEDHNEEQGDKETDLGAHPSRSDPPEEGKGHKEAAIDAPESDGHKGVCPETESAEGVAGGGDAERGRPVAGITNAAGLPARLYSNLPEDTTVGQDCLLVYSTQPGFVAFLPLDGSPFIKAFHDQVQSLATDQPVDLLKLLTRVSGDVARDYETNMKKKEMPWITSRLTKDILVKRECPANP